MSLKLFRWKNKYCGLIAYDIYMWELDKHCSVYSKDLKQGRVGFLTHVNKRSSRMAHRLASKIGSVSQEWYYIFAVNEIS